MFSSPLDLILACGALLCAGLGLQFLLLTAARLRRGRLLGAALEGGVGAALLAAAAALCLLGLNFYTYQRLTAEQAVADLSFVQIRPQHYRCTLRVADQPNRTFELDGDDWELDARVVEWKPPAVLLGLDPRFRLERLSGRYREIDQERKAQRSVYPLAPKDRIDMWPLLMQANRYLPWLDAYYGSAAYLPMADGAAYQVRLGSSGLVARPANEAAKQALGAWH